MSEWIDSITQWLSANPEWLGAAIFIVACVECLAIAGVIVPGTVLLFAIGVMAGGSLSLMQTLLLAYAGGLVGDVLSYWVGKHFHQNIRRLPVVRHHPEWITHAELYFLRYGAVSLLVGRFIGPLRPMLPMVAGMLDMPFIRFLLISLVSGAGWAVAYLLPGWVAGAAIRLPLPEGFWLEAGLVCALALVLVGLSAHASLGSRRHANGLTATLSVLLLGALLVSWPYLDSLDLGLMTLIQASRTQALEPFMLFTTQMGNIAPQLTVACVLIGLLLAFKQWRSALFAGAALALTALGNSALKALFARTRPEVIAEPLTSFSFPSAHSSASFAFFLVLALLAGRGQPPRWRLTWLLLASLPAGLIAYTRLYLGVHWATDLAGGALLAAACCALALLIGQRRTPLPPLPAPFWWILLPSCALVLAGFAFSGFAQALELYRR